MKPKGGPFDIVANFYPLANVSVFHKISCNERSNIYE